MTKNAVETVRAESATIRAMLTNIQERIDLYQDAAEDGSASWGDAGDLMSVRSKLAEIVQFLGGED